MIGSVSSIGGSVGSQRLEKTPQRASGRYVEAAEGSFAADDRPQQLAIADRRAEAREEIIPTAAILGNPASAPFMAQLAALGLGDSATGERRIRRDPSVVVTRADALYRDGYRRVTDLEPGFFGTAEY